MTKNINTSSVYSHKAEADFVKAICDMSDCEVLRVDQNGDIFTA